MFLSHWSQDHETALKNFGSYLRILNRAERTRNIYDAIVRDFLRKTPKPVEELGAQEAFDYLVDLEEKRHLAPQSLNQRRAALAVFYREILDKPLPRTPGVRIVVAPNG